MKMTSALRETVVEGKWIVRGFFRRVRGEIRYHYQKVARFWRKEQKFRLMVCVSSFSLAVMLIHPFWALRHFAYMGILWSVIGFSVFYLAPWLYRAWTKDGTQMEKVATALILPFVIALTAYMIWIPITGANFFPGETGGEPAIDSVSFVILTSMTLSIVPGSLGLLLYILLVLAAFMAWLGIRGYHLAGWLIRMIIWYRRKHTPYSIRPRIRR